MADLKIKISDKKDFLESFRQKCRQKKINLTPQRLAIYSILTEAYNHPTAEEVFHHAKEIFPDIAIDTVYRTLNTFSQMGLIDVVEGYGEAKRYDPDTGPHHHFRCQRCGQIIDFQDECYSKLQAPAMIRRKYRVSNIKVVIEGLCDRCSHKG